MNQWAKGEKIEQVRQHLILGLKFDTRMNWLEHIKNTKATLAHTTCGELTKGAYPVEKFQNGNFEKPVVLKVSHDYNNKKIVLELFKILRSSSGRLPLAHRP
jgi:hypothetical protein